METYNKDVISLSHFEIYEAESKKSKIKLTYYENGSDRVCIEETDGTKKVVGTGLAVGGIKTTSEMSSFGIFGLKEYFIFLVLADVHKINLNGKECYAVKIDNKEDYIDIETGTVLKSVYNDSNETVNYYYEFGTVTDEDIKRPEV